MAIHKIKAQDDRKDADKSKDPPKKLYKVSGAKTEKTPKKSTKKPFLLFRPFLALGRYFRNAWRELRMVKWPTRKFTWKMTLSVIVYVILFGILIGVLDILFTLLFSNIIK